MTRRSPLIYGLLGAVWALVLVWQAAEHRRTREAARTALLNRARDITTTLETVVRSQRRFGGMVSQERLESALSALASAGELNAVALFNATGEFVASAGNPIRLETPGPLRPGEQWEEHSVRVVHLVDFGAGTATDRERSSPTIVLPRREGGEPGREDRGPRPPPPLQEEMGTNRPPSEPPRPEGWAERAQRGEATNRPGERERPAWMRFGRPPMNDQEYRALLERRGMHGLIIALSADAVQAACVQDLWLRGIIAAFATVAALGMGLAWRNLTTSSELQMRLVRASQQNLHLKEMNLAAAGLAHETRNPLNIIRGLAQMISKQGDASPEVRRQSLEIVDETDRVTAQLSEFINYSRPREVRRTAVALNAVLAEVVRALNVDLQEKQVRVETPASDLAVEADEQLLRQALFNLLLNAVQAVGVGGEIRITAEKADAEAVLTLSDNGPGVPPEQRTEIFKPYFTTREEGTGLGLAVVHQIVLAHGWEIECLANEPRGAIFRLSHLTLAAKSSRHAA